jgi:hypothetical protein
MTTGNSLNGSNSQHRLSDQISANTRILMHHGRRNRTPLAFGEQPNGSGNTPTPVCWLMSRPDYATRVARRSAVTAPRSCRTGPRRKLCLPGSLADGILPPAKTVLLSPLPSAGEAPSPLSPPRHNEPVRGRAGLCRLRPVSAGCFVHHLG